MVKVYNWNQYETSGESDLKKLGIIYRPLSLPFFCLLLSAFILFYPDFSSLFLGILPRVLWWFFFLADFLRSYSFLASLLSKTIDGALFTVSYSSHFVKFSSLSSSLNNLFSPVSSGWWLSIWTWIEHQRKEKTSITLDVLRKHQSSKQSFLFRDKAEIKMKIWNRKIYFFDFYWPLVERFRINLLSFIFF